jgi:hypothetical protein
MRPKTSAADTDCSGMPVGSVNGDRTTPIGVYVTASIAREAMPLDTSLDKD